MEIGVIGLSHKNASVEIREKFAFTTSRKEQTAKELGQAGVGEFVILSTCNRTEIYFAGQDIIQTKNTVVTYCEAVFDSDIARYLYSYEKRNAITHLFRVACGLDSLVLGEDQILGQVKDAHAFSLAHKISGKVLNKVFRESITFAKKAKSEHKMSDCPLSISSIAVKYISQQIGGLSGKNVLIMGMGKIGKLLLRYLYDRQDVDIYLTKRVHKSCKKYRGIQQEFPRVELIDFDERYEHIPNMDVVFTATASPHIIVKAERLPELLSQVVFMDMAVPRDVDRQMKSLRGAVYHDVDDLKAIVDESEVYREEVAKIIEVKIDGKVQEVEAWVVNAQLDATIHKINKMCDDVYKETWDLIEKKTNLSQKDEQNMQKIVKSCIGQVVKTPINQLKGMEKKSEIESMKSALEYLYDMEEV
ncbi:MAG: glutamyl-tRNA reductase [Clostridia bacterium]|jgi:glutamyl-tRNA reductase|nr:glutamyl-tRNA reductase [Clostridia bacterium]